MIPQAQVTRVGAFVGGKYRIIRMLAEGGMGVVYEAQHVVVKRRFAVKFLRPHLTHRLEILNRFHREAQAAGALESENIAAALDFGMLDDGTPYIVMEYLVGESLGSLLAREGCLPTERAADLCLQACRGMESAHQSGIVHRDLKPENLFVCRREGGTDLVKVLDFGIAKLEQFENNKAATRTGTILGTPAYMSPEQARGDKTIDHRTDVYGLGAILYEMLSGTKPHPGESHNAILHHIATHAAVPLATVKGDLPVALVEAVERALSPDANARQPSVEALGQMVAPFAKRITWPAPPPDKEPASMPEATSSARLVPLDSTMEASPADAAFNMPRVMPPENPTQQPGRAGRMFTLGAGSIVGAVAVAAIAIASNRHWGSTLPPRALTVPANPSKGALDAAGTAGDGSRPVGGGGAQTDVKVSAAPFAGPPLELEAPPARMRKRANPLSGRPAGRFGGRPAQRNGIASPPSEPQSSRPIPSAPWPTNTGSRKAQADFDSQNPYSQ